MNIKEWLSRGRDLDKEISALEQAKCEAYYACISTTSKLKEDIVKAEKTPNAKLERLAELNLQIDRRIDDLIEIKREILEAINDVEDATYRAILIQRYVNMKKWEYIATEMNYDYYWILKLHGRALKQVRIDHEKTPLYVL